MAMLLDTEIRSTTDLQKKTKDVLDAASEHPVVIRRENGSGDIALLSHATARRALAAEHVGSLLVPVLNYFLARMKHREGEPEVPYPVELEWAREFDNDDLLEFVKEFNEACGRVATGDFPIAAVNDVLEQWRISAMVLRDGALKTRLDQERSIILAPNG